MGNVQVLLSAFQRQLSPPQEGHDRCKHVDPAILVEQCHRPDPGDLRSGTLKADVRHPDSSTWRFFISSSTQGHPTRDGGNCGVTYTVQVSIPRARNNKQRIRIEATATTQNGTDGLQQAGVSCSADGDKRELVVRAGRKSETQHGVLESEGAISAQCSMGASGSGGGSSSVTATIKLLDR